MKALVVYYSLEGNTAYAANQIAQALKADTLRLEPVNAYPLGAKKFLVGGRDAMTGVTPELKPYTVNLETYDTVVIGTPLWAWTFAPPIRTFLKAHDLKGKKLAFFVTSMGGQDQKCFARLQEMTGSADAPQLRLIEPMKRKKPEDQTMIAQFAAQIQTM